MLPATHALINNNIKLVQKYYIKFELTSLKDEVTLIISSPQGNELIQATHQMISSH